MSDATAADTVALCEALLATYAAAEMQLRVLAASELSFAANVRIHAAAEARSRAILAMAGVSRRAPEGDLGRDEDTEELLHAALGATAAQSRSAQGPQRAAAVVEAAPAALDDGPEGSADVSIPLITDEAAEPEPELEPEPEANIEEQLRQLRAAIGETDDDLGEATEEGPMPEEVRSFVSFDEPAGIDSLVSFDEPADLPMQLVEDPEEEPLVRFDDHAGSGLITFDDPPEVDADPEPDAFDDEESTALREAAPAKPPAPAQRRGSRPPLQEVEEFDLIAEDATDAPSEDALITAAHALPSLPAEGRGPKEDLESFEEEEANAAPIGKIDAAPAQPRRAGSLDSTAEVVVRQPEAPAEVGRKPITLGAPRAVAPESVAEKPQAPARPAAAAPAKKGAAPAPTIRDGSEPRPRSAAIQLGATGGKVLRDDEDELIEMGEADMDIDLEAGGGFSLQVEEHEEVEEEEEFEEDEVEKLPELEVQAASRGPDAGEIRAMLDDAIDAARAGDNDRAILLFSDVLDGDPDNVDAHIGRGRVFLDLSDYARAMSDFTVAEDLAPENPEIQVAVGDLYFARKDYRKAIDFYNVALEMAPAYGMAYCRRGISHYYRKNYQDAVDDLTRAQQLDPEIANIATFVLMAKKKVVPGARR